MSKQVKKTTAANSKPLNNKSGFNLFSIIPEKFKTPIAILGIIVLLFAFYSPIMFGEKTINSFDNQQMKSTRSYINKDHEGFSLWNPYLFGGMPAYATSHELRWFDLSSVTYSLVTKVYSAAFANYEAIYTFSFLMMAITGFLFMRARGAGRGVSFFVASVMSFSSGLVVLYFIGHETKLMCLSLLPFLLMMMLKFQKQIKLLDILILTFVMHLLVLFAHVQIIYYTVMLVVVYFLFYFVYSFIKKDKFLSKQLLKSLGATVIAGVIAISMSLDTYLQNYEYRPYSQRASATTTENAGKTQNKTETELYASNTRWSFSPGEVITFLIPSYYGFGNSTYKDEASGVEEPINTYMGQMENVDSPMYMGVVVLILGLIAFFSRWKDPFIKFSLILIAFFLLLSFGKNFPIIFNLLYNYLPLFDVFRAPSMILHIVQILFPILAGLALLRIIELKNENNLKFSNIMKYSGIAFSALAILSLLLSSTFANAFTNRINEFVVNHPAKAQEFNFLSKYISGMYVGDLQINLFLIAILFWCIYFFMKNKFDKSLLVGAVCILALFDLFRISGRSAGYTDSADVNALYTQPDYVTVIKQQKDAEPFRIASFKTGRTLSDVIGGQNYNPNYHTYFLLEDIGGYSSVKPKAFNDIYNEVGLMNPTLWRMAGVKYLVFPQPINIAGYTLLKNEKTTFTYRNDMALPRAYFVDSVEAKSGSEILNLLRSNGFDPKNKAFVDNLDFKADKPGADAYAKITSYGDAKLTLDVNATGSNFLFFSTNYMPKGWKALIDGNETKIIKANHTFMGIVVPNGKHKIEFVYAPSSFYLGKNISLILNILLFGAIIFLVVMNYRKKIAAGNTQPA